MSDIQFNTDEQTVLRQLFDQWMLASGYSVSEEIRGIDNASYVVGFKPAPGQIRLGKTEWKEFVAKLKQIVR